LALMERRKTEVGAVATAYRREAAVGARTKCMGKVPFIATWAKGGWDGWDGSALAASARLRYDSSACTRGRRRAVSSYCDDLVWRQHAHGIVL
jgi:hypothetical protein